MKAALRPEDFAIRPADAETGCRAAARHRILANSAVRKTLVILVIAALWELASRLQGNPLMLPSFSAAAGAFLDALLHDRLLGMAATSLGAPLQGYGLGVALALALTALAVSWQPARDTLETLTAMFNPLPAVALLPLAMLWFGLGRASLIFVLVHAVLWPVALATLQGFLGVPETLRMAGRNYGLKGLRFVVLILVPAALPAILSGLKIGWAFAWRTLIAAELVFGVSSGQGGLGWFIFQARNELLTERVFAGLAAVILIGVVVESAAFRTIENITVRRWGMQR